MDLVRLGLERSRSATEAVEVMTGLLESCGQGGIADAAHGDAYDSSFLVADPREAFVLETAGSDYAVAPARGAGAISNRLGIDTEWALASAGVEPGTPFTQFRDTTENTAFADVRLAASRRFLDSTPSGGLTARATAAHMRDHGTGPWGAPGDPGSVQPPPPRVGEDFAGVTVCMHVRDLCVTTASMIAELPDALDDGAPLRVYVVAGSPCVGIYIPAFPRSMKGPPPFVPVELSGEELWRAAETLRERIEADPDALSSVRALLQPVEDEIWFEADEVLEHPDRWASVAGSWGSRALDALTSCIP
jgi:secernin